MAKFEESDPRWKVKDMGDQGKNVNGWHWNEKDVFPYFKEQFTAKFDDKVIFEGATNGPAGLLCDFKCWKLDKCTGEASVAKRKGNKVIVIYEIEATMKWEVTLKNSAGETISTAKGSYEMPCIDTVEDIDKFEIQIKYNKTGGDHQAANDYAKKQGQDEVRRMIVAIIMQLKEQAGQSQTAATPAAPSAPAAAPAPAPAAAPAPKAATTSSDNRSIQVSSEFTAPPNELFDCFTVVQKCMAFTQSRCQVGTTVGEPLMWYDGAVTGKLIECEPNKKLVYEWRQTAWNPADVSKCTITFEPGKDGPATTKVTLKQTGIPYKDAHGNDDMPHVVKEGWKRNFFDRIKMVFGFGNPEFS
eukprot:Tamp_14696.p1 GENE.Tamp_14696~~Tamp_14696.p1  ORF type:complete len:357 (+),score=97.90 Tamp_14696:387-1457(+)